MAIPLEAEIEDEIVRRARAHGWTTRKVKWVGSRNAPDRMFFRDGTVVIMEVKRPGKTVTGTQRKEYLRLKEVFPDTYVVDSVEGAMMVLDRLGGW